MVQRPTEDIEHCMDWDSDSSCSEDSDTSGLLAKIEVMDAPNTVIPDNRFTVTQFLGNFEFWSELKGKIWHENMMNRVTRPLPQSSMGGLQRPYAKLWGSSKPAMSIWLFLRVALNVGVTMKQFYTALKSDDVALEGASNVTTVFTHKGLKVCDLSSHQCTSYEVSRYVAWQIDAWFEFVFITLLALGCLLVIVPYLLLPDGCPLVSRLSLKPGRRPWFFIFAPRLAAGFSSMLFLEFVDFKHLKGVLMDGEFELWSDIFLCSCFPSRRRSETPSKVNNRSGVSLWLVLHLAVVICLFAFSAQALLVKMMRMHFAATSDFSGWNLQLWLAFLGFTNQVVGVLAMHDLEFCRVVRFVFGQSDARIDTRQCRTATMFFHLLGRKMSTGRLVQERNRFACVAILVTLDANDLQKLLLSVRAQKRFDKAMAERLKVLQQMNTSTEANSFYEQLETANNHRHDEGVKAKRLLKEAKLNHVPFLERYRDELLQNARRHQENVPQSATLRLAATVQDRIEDIAELGFSSDDAEHED